MKRLFFILLLFIPSLLWGQLMIPGMAGSATSGGDGGSSLLTGLISYWNFDEASGVAVDGMGVNNLIVTGATQNQTGKLGTAYTFDGNDYVGGIDAYKYTGVFSISCWVNTTTAGSFRFFISNYEDPEGYCIGMTDANHATFELGNAATASTAIGYTDITTGDWFHIVAVWDLSYIRIYVNGTEEDNTPLSSAAYSGGADEHFTIGNRRENLYWIGGIDAIYVWNKALSSSEVTELYNSGTGITHPF